jgi:hypothetical protein
VHSSLAVLLALTVVPLHAAASSLRSDHSCRGVKVVPSDNIQALIERRRRHTTFCFRKGVYELSSTIWTGAKHPTIDLRSGAIINGQGGSFVGIDGDDSLGGERGTIILGGVFQNFGNENAPIWVSPLTVRSNWVVKGTEFRRNFNAGLAVQGDSARVSNVESHHNGRYGIVVTAPCMGCPGPSDVLIEHSEIAHNNTRMLPTNDDAGGTKFSGGTDGMTVRNNVVHDNYGAGLWWDGYHTNAHVYGNLIYANRNWGIMWELSYGGARIHHNTLRDNGIGDGSSPNFFANVQLLISCSDGSRGEIEIYENTIEGAAHPLALINHNVHPTRTRNVYVHDNTFTLRSSASRVGAMAFDGLTELFTASANNRFEDNTYKLHSRRGAYWAWDGQTLTWRQWRAVGHDEDGIVR